MRGLAMVGLLSALIGHSTRAAAADTAADLVPTALPRPTGLATRIDAADAPSIDGDLSDAVWGRAQPLDKFYQVEPIAGTTPSERTEIRVLYDSQTLYISIHCFDDEPGKIVASLKARDGFSPNDDFVRIALDPQMTRRNTYAFEITALGGRVDALVQNNSDILTNWNVVWAARARIVADGWTAEMAIPFRELSFDPGRSEWGFDVMRQVRRKSETMRWAPTPSNMNFNDMSLAGTLAGFHDLQQGAGLDVQLYGIARYQHQWLPPAHDTVTFRPSANVFYKITPALTGTLTMNPDFSDAQLDPRTVNTTRFSLFTPEVRQFFLQDAAAFAFGGLAFTPAATRPVSDPNGQPFFSRNLGLIRGEPVNIVGGAKVSGEFDGLRIGALSVRTAEGQGVPGQTLSVARIAVPVLDNSTVGAIVTNGDPNGLTHDTLAGTDFHYLNPDFGHGQRMVADTFFERSMSDQLGNDDAFGATVSLPNEPWGGELDFKQIGAAFAPALGFANRKGIRDYRGQIAHRDRWSSGPLRWFEVGSREVYVSGLDSALQSRTDSAWVSGYTRSADTLTFTLLNNTENVGSLFALPGNVTVAAGHYNWVTVNPQITTTQARPLSAAINVNCCRFYNGRLLSTDVKLDYRPNGTLDITLEHVMSLIRMPSGSVDIHIGMITTAVNFTPDMQLNAQIEYDNITKRFAVLTRYRWEYQPGQEIFAALGEQSAVTGSMESPLYRSQLTGFLFRLGHTFQF